MVNDAATEVKPVMYAKPKTAIELLNPDIKWFRNRRACFYLVLAHLVVSCVKGREISAA